MRKLAQAAVLALLLMPIGCESNFFTQINVGTKQGEETGELALSIGGLQPKITIDGRRIQSLPLLQIVQARITVKGEGIAQPLAQTISLVGGAGSARITSIPVGKNRILTAEGIDAAGTVVPGALLRAVVNIAKGSNQASINWSTTPAGGVFNRLFLEDIRLNTKYSSTISAEEVQSLVSDLTVHFSVPHPSLIDAEAIANAIREDAGIVPLSESRFVIPSAYVELIIKGLPSDKTISATMTDPASSGLTSLNNGTFRIPAITPGNWSLCLDSADFGSSVSAISFERGATASVIADYGGVGAFSVDFGNPNSTPLPSVSPSVSPTVSPTPTPTPSPAASAFYNVIVQFDQ